MIVSSTNKQHAEHKEGGCYLEDTLIRCAVWVLIFNNSILEGYFGDDKGKLDMDSMLDNIKELFIWLGVIKMWLCLCPKKVLTC